MRSRKTNKTKIVRKASKHCWPVLVKVNDKFKYSDQVLFSLTRFKSKNHQDKPNKLKSKQRQPNQQQTKSLQVLQQLQLVSSAVDDAHLSSPLLIKYAQSPSFMMPNELEVAIHKGQQISYSDDVLYYRLSTQQVLAEMSKTCSSDSKQQLNYSVPQMELPEDAYEVPEIVRKYLKSIYKVNLWIYSGRRFTDWHYDGHDNFLYVHQGKKIVYLAEHTAIKSKSIFSLNNNHSDAQVLDLSKIAKAEVIPGRCLYIPKGYWHKVITHGQPSIALNYWGNSINQTLRKLSPVQKTLILKSLLYQLAQGYCKKAISSWSTLSESQMQNFRLLAGTKIIEENKVVWE